MIRRLEKSTELPTADEVLNAPAVAQPVFAQPTAVSPAVQPEAMQTPASSFVQRDAWTMPAANGHQ